MKLRRQLQLIILGFLVALLTSCAGKPQTQSQQANGTTSLYPTRGSLEPKQEKFWDHVQAEGKIEVLASGFEWSEGPLWLPTESRLVFSDVPQNRVYSWKEGETEATVWLEPSGYTGDTPRGGEPGSNGLALSTKGGLLLCQHGDRRVAAMLGSPENPAAEFVSIAETYEGKRFNSPNDLCVDSSGQVFFTDPPYGLIGQMESPDKEIDFQGVYRVDRTVTVHLITDTLTRPNGIALSPDGRTLYVANSDPGKAMWVAYSLDEKGNPTGLKWQIDATPLVGRDNPGLPDGLKVKSDGTIYATGPGGVWVISPEGEHLGTIRTGLPTANCALGPGYLYMTADSLLLRVPIS